MAIKKENSTTASIVGYQGPASEEMLRKNNQPYTEEVDLEEIMAEAMLNDEEVEEVVKKRGNVWVVFDDKTGLEKGVYPKRSDAWKHQRVLRKGQAARKKNKANRSPNPFSTESPHAHKNPSVHRQPTSKKEALMLHLKQKLTEGFSKMLLEKSAMSYVFENSPLNPESEEWDMFLSRLSKQVIFSDEKLKNILMNAAKMEVKLLKDAVSEIQRELKGYGFEVEPGKIGKNQNNDVMLSLMVILPEDNKKLLFGIELENRVPLIITPDATKMALNSMEPQLSKELRVGIMTCQEKRLDKMTDLLTIHKKRDEYLGKIEGQTEKVLKSLDLLQLEMLRYVLKTKLGNVK